LLHYLGVSVKDTPLKSKKVMLLLKRVSDCGEVLSSYRLNPIGAGAHEK
jgi:hypothetical protein